MSNPESQQRTEFLKTCLIKDLRVECRNRGISPAGSRDTLLDKLNTAMTVTGETSFGRQGLSNPLATGCSVNNYARPEGQNVGNFVTDRSSSRVLAPPGGKSSVHFFGQTTPSKAVEDRTRRSMSPPAVQPPAVTEVRPAGPVVRQGLSLADNDYPTQTEPVGERRSSNNYSRPGNRQNVGNYITGRNTSRVLAPPGGGSNITFG